MKNKSSRRNYKCGHRPQISISTFTFNTSGSLFTLSYNWKGLYWHLQGGSLGVLADACCRFVGLGLGAEYTGAGRDTDLKASGDTVADIRNDSQFSSGSNSRPEELTSF